MHLCLYYMESEQLWRQCRHLLHSAESAGWLYIADEHAITAVNAAIGDIANGVIIDSAETTFRASLVRIPSLVAELTDQLTRAAQAHPTVWLFVEMSWAIRTPSAAVYLREYEAAIAQLTQQYALTTVCLYNQNLMLDRQLMIGLHTHRCLVIGDQLVTNPHFVPPHLFSARNSRAQFNYWLNALTPDALPLASDEATKVDYKIEKEPMLLTQATDEGRWKIRCFGRLRVYRSDGTPIQWNVVSGATHKTKTLFAFLLFRGETGATAAEIADLLWPDAADLKQGLSRLYHTVRCLRLALSPEPTATRQSPFVLNEDERYFLALPPHSWIDLPMFEELCYRGSKLMAQQNFTEALVCLQAAEQLYSGDLLADISEKYTSDLHTDWCWSRRQWYQQMYIKVLVKLAEIHRHTKNTAQALTYCDKALELDPVSELAHQEKMQVLASVNRRDALIRQYRLYERALERSDMGKPTQEIKSLFEKLKTN